MNEFMQIVFLAQVGTTMAMVGIIWFAQIVHYPLFTKVDPSSFKEYQDFNLRRTVLIVIPLQMIEMGTALLLVWKTPAGLLPLQVWANLILIGLIWCSTAFLQVPRHYRLTRGFDLKGINFLINTNWIRTIGWSIRCVLVLWMIKSLM
ncbi:MAG: hypothetical protein OS130_06360 [Thermodesulfobacteriota bacterium]|jgi:hypothetical protein|nr:MAG: hypothetical protein OS130_06360 [Thermodesulfobacteriota bacterium]